ncbi:MAG: amino acid ABC transporter ATP-binding protein [Lachnospiraceae bacterium]|nr:amino acid ABC transporter ATP-binding protein [Lachnospiraceae bacterium]
MSELLKVTHLQKAYGDNVVLKDINLSVKQGEVVVIIGPSGCGKSTFLRCLNGLEKIQGGEIAIDGSPVEAESRDISKIRQKIGMVFQSYELFPHKNVIDNLLLAPVKVQKRDKEEVKEEAQKLLAKVGLAGKEEFFPRQLSGGQKQRVAIVRALLMHPEIILFDEVTAALDPEMVQEVLHTMLKLAKSGSTMIIVTHEMAFARAIADRIVFFDEGEIIEETREVEQFFEKPKTDRARRFLRTFTFSKSEID